MTSTELQTKATEIKGKIHSALYNLRANYLVLGSLLSEYHDMSLWKMEYDSWEAFLGDPEIAMKRSTAYNLMRVHALYVKKLNIPAERLLSIGHTKLLKVADLVESNPEEWLSRAESLGKQDLAVFIAEAGGKAVSPPAPPPRPSPGGCVNGCEGDVDSHHFPVGRVSSQGEAGDWTIPLCRKCHTEYHQEPKEWTWTYRKNWMRHLVNRVK